MKITQNQQDELEALLGDNAHEKTLKEFVSLFRAELGKGNIKVKSCPATNCFSRLVRGPALNYICDTLYPAGVDDSHIRTFYRKLYKKHS